MTDHWLRTARSGRSLWFALAILALLALGQSRALAQANDVIVLSVEGPVTPAMASYFERGIEIGRQNESAVVIVLDTPGGDVNVTLDIVSDLRAARVPVIVFVGPSGAQAASAGSIITLAAHAAGMAPETVIGAASPVGPGGAELEETLFRKVSEDLKAKVRSLAERRGEAAVTLAEAMIDEAQAVNEKEALEVGLIDAVAQDVPDLLRQLDGLTVLVAGEPVTLQTAGAFEQPLAMNLLERVLHAVANPVIIGILFAIGVQAIIAEISSPGGWVAGFIGVLFVSLALYGAGQLPVNWLGLGLIIAAFALFVLEVTTATSGALAITGTITLLAGFLVLFNSPGTPAFARISITSAIGITLFTAAFFIFLLTKAWQAHQSRPATGAEALVGQVGPVRQAFTRQTGRDSYAGMVLIAGELWQATAGEEIQQGEAVEVTAVRGFRLQVKKVGT